MLLTAHGVTKRFGAVDALVTVFDVADRIVVLRLGRRVATFDRRTTSREAVAGEIIGVKPRPVAA